MCRRGWGIHTAMKVSAWWVYFCYVSPTILSFVYVDKLACMESRLIVQKFCCFAAKCRRCSLSICSISLIYSGKGLVTTLLFNTRAGLCSAWPLWLPVLIPYLLYLLACGLWIFVWSIDNLYEILYKHYIVLLFFFQHFGPYYSRDSTLLFRQYPIIKKILE